MNTHFAYKSLIFGSVAVLMAGCTSVTDKVVASKVDDSFKKGSTSPEVPNDIKGILVAGGLDAKNPSAPTSETKIAEMKPSKTSAEGEVEKLIAKLEPALSSPASTADQDVVLMAALENKNAPKVDETKPERPPVERPTVTTRDITPREAPKAVALTSTTVKLSDTHDALEKLTIESKPQISSVTYTYPEIGVASLEVKSQTTPATERVQSVPHNTVKATKSGRVVAPTPSDMASIKKPRRF